MSTRKYLVSTILIVTAIAVFSFLVSFSNLLNIRSEKSKKSKGRDEPPNYAVVFPQDKVNRIDLVIKPSDWKKVLNNLRASFGERHDSLRQCFMPPPIKESDSMGFHNHSGFSMPLDNTHRMAGPPPMFNGDKDSGHFHRPYPNGGMLSVKDFTPIYIPCTFKFYGMSWEGVGFRVKGNSSLMMSWMGRVNKLPFRLDFNKYKDSLPETRHQSFFGFRKISFSSNNNDRTFLREKITSDILRESGVKAAQTAFYRVYVDFGKGPIYFGLYTAVEIIEDTMLKTQFDDSSGNCYKPDGSSATFAGEFEKGSFVKKNNKKKGDWSDVESFFEILNSSERLSNPKQWCNKVESVFDVSDFVKWLAINTTIQNWDSYGTAPHNYYLYHSTTSNKLVWIPWDHNEAMESRGRGLSISLNNVSDDWPLIRYLMDQPEYQEIYRKSMKSFVDSTFNSDSMNYRIDHFKKMITPFIIGENGEQKSYTFLNSSDDFYRAIDQLKQHIEMRNKIARKYLGL